MITIKLYYKGSSEPASGYDVSLGFDSSWRGVTSRQSTNSNGEAHFDSDDGQGEVYVNGDKKYSGYLSGQVTVYV